MTRLIAATLLMAAQAADPSAAPSDELAQHRNLGKAFYENPTTQAESVAEFGKALALAPASARDRLNYGLALLAAGKSAEGIAEIEKVQAQQPALPHSWFNLGVQFKKGGDFDKSRTQFEGFVKRVPSEATGHYNLGVLYKLANRNPDAIKAFETASNLNPGLAAPHFQLYNLYRQAGRRDEAAAQLKQFQAAKEAAVNSPSSEDMEWSWYSEILDEVDPAASTPADAPREWKFTSQRLSPPIPGALTRPVVFDAQGDGRPDFAVAVGGNLRLYSGGPGAAAPAIIARQVRFAAAADFDNDGLTDLCVLTTRGVALLTNRKGTFTSKLLTAAPSGRYDFAVWLDYDHDYDLDLFLFGETNALLRNEGGGNFGNRTADFPFVKGQPTGAVPFRLVPDSKSFDLAVTYRDREAVLYRDQLAGKFTTRPLAALPREASLVSAIDADNSGTLDLLWESPGKGGILFNVSAPNQDARIEWAAAEIAGPVAVADWENRGVQDLIAGGTAMRYSGSRRYQAGAAVAGAPSGAVAYVSADFNGDGKADLATVSTGGAVHLLTNATSTPFQSMRVALGGVKNPKLAAGSEVEVKIGGLYQKKLYAGFPLVFGIRDAKKIDAVRITWPNGLIQSEANQPVRAQNYQEAQRLSGSCPQVWTWNGREFVYVSDVLGVAPLGAMSGDGSYFPVDHLEHIQIPDGALAARDGRYEIRLTEELSEIAYIDQVKLIAVDHPAAHSIWVNEKFQSPPYPALKLYSTGLRLKPRGSSSKRREFFTMKLGPETKALTKPILVLDGWVDWADGSQFRAASQRGQGGELRMPSLEALVDGKWRTVLPDMGLPAGKPKSIVVELKPEWLAGGALRIASNLDVFWTRAFLAEQGPAPRIAGEAVAQRADVHFRGFSRAVIHPEGLEPEKFFYPHPLPASMWNPTPGMYTRFGDVTPLTGKADDQFVIMGSGDELTLDFDAAAFPPVPASHKRSFILAVDGWAKDRDANTAHSASVEPLPFHGMSRYPYPANQHFPDTPALRAWRKQYNTRPALRLLRPLTSLIERPQP